MNKNNINVLFDKESNYINIRGDLKEELILYSIEHMISSSINGVSESQFNLMKDIINEENFDSIWNVLPSSRSNLVTTLIYIVTYNYGVPLYLFSKQFSIQKLKEIEALLSSIGDIDSNIERLRIIKAIYPKFDYLGEIDKFISNNVPQNIVNLWIESSLEYLDLNEEYISKIYSKVKRCQGSTEIKSKILLLAINKNILPEKEIRSIAESSPINLKRQVLTALVACKRRSSYKNNNIGSIRNDVDREKFNLNLSKKSEELMMKFSSTKDSKILSELIDNLSFKNIPWILPIVSPYPFLTKKAQARINRGV